MPAPAIIVRDLWKQYALGRKQARYATFRETLAASWTHVVSSRLRSAGRKAPNSTLFWALQGVSFEVAPGEIVGLIGRNGAGKSTLLKILSQITYPARGEVVINGRVASLLEVGTGFHPELTGRENVFLNGAILGMSRAEIRSKLDSIVDFSGVHEFLDTPVKRYSSGMYLRLAFSVAAHLETDILLVDEVLAVGDAEFQNKCMGHMKNVSGSGRTVLFVSHNMDAVEKLCTRAVLMQEGQVVVDSTDVPQVIGRYLGAAQAGAAAWSQDKGVSNDCFHPLKMYLAKPDGSPATMPMRNDTENWLVIEANILRFDPSLHVGYALFDQEGRLLYWSLANDTPANEWPKVPQGHVRFRSRIPPHFLNEGDYRIELNASLYFKEWLYKPGHNSPSIAISIRGGLSESPVWLSRRPGMLAPVLTWEVEQLR